MSEPELSRVHPTPDERAQPYPIRSSIKLLVICLPQVQKTIFGFFQRSHSESRTGAI
jgi:hypothetical protein